MPDDLASPDATCVDPPSPPRFELNGHTSRLHQSLKWSIAFASQVLPYLLSQTQGNIWEATGSCVTLPRRGRAWP